MKFPHGQSQVTIVSSELSVHACQDAGRECSSLKKRAHGLSLVSRRLCVAVCLQPEKCAAKIRRHNGSVCSSNVVYKVSIESIGCTTVAQKQAAMSPTREATQERLIFKHNPLLSKQSIGILKLLGCTLSVIQSRAN